MSKRVLMLCYYFPPIKAVGCNRSVAFASRLASHDWIPTVLTVKKSADIWVGNGMPVPTDITIERSYECNCSSIVELLHGIWSRFLRFFRQEAKFNYFRDVLLIPDAQIFWLSFVKGVKLARYHDVIYVSCSPFSAAITGALISLVCKKPLVIDFRDPWVFNPYISHTRIHFMIIKWLERWVIRRANTLILNTPGTQEVYARNYPEQAAQMVVITNGYQMTPKSVDVIASNKQRTPKKFIIMHVGTFYGSRKPDLLLEAIVKLANPDVEFWQIGRDGDWFREYRDRVTIKVLGERPHDEAINMMGRANLLYLCQGEELGVDYYVSVAAKTYEYLSTGIPILADCPNGDNAELVRHLSSCSHVVTSKRIDDIFHALQQAMSKASNVEHTVSQEFVTNYNWDFLTKKLVTELNKLPS